MGVNDKDVLGTNIRPTDFTTAARRHGRHFARYVYAGRFVRNKRVIDAACGSGFGSAYLATTAETVLGLDLDDELLNFAQEHFSRANVQFQKHDLHQPIDLNQKVHVVISLETLEHVRDPQRVLSVLAQELRNDGIALISVPNGTKELTRGSHKTYHPRQFTSQEFEQLVRRRFASVRFQSQVYHKNVSHYVRKLMGQACHHADNYRFLQGLNSNAKTWLAICQQPIRKD